MSNELEKVARARLLADLEDSMNANLQKFEGFEITPEHATEMIETVARTIDKACTPMIEILGSHVENDVLTIDVKVPIYMSSLLNR